MVFVPFCVPRLIASLGARRPPRSVCGWSEAGGGCLQMSRMSTWGARCALMGPKGPNRGHIHRAPSLGAAEAPEDGTSVGSDGPAWARLRVPAQEPPQDEREWGLHSLPQGERVQSWLCVRPSQTRAGWERPRAPYALAVIRLIPSSLPALGDHWSTFCLQICRFWTCHMNRIT